MDFADRFAAVGQTILAIASWGGLAFVGLLVLVALPKLIDLPFDIRDEWRKLKQEELAREAAHTAAIAAGENDPPTERL